MTDLDAELARIEPGAALFDAATRLRISWRLASDDPEAAAEAQTLAETLMLRRWNPYDALLRARAAIRADRPRDAWGSLQRVAGRTNTTQRGRVLAERVLEVARELPEDRFRAVRDEINRRADGPGSGELRDAPAPDEMPR